MLGSRNHWSSFSTGSSNNTPSTSPTAIKRQFHQQNDELSLTKPDELNSPVSTFKLSHRLSPERKHGHNPHNAFCRSVGSKFSTHTTSDHPFPGSTLSKKISGVQRTSSMPIFSSSPSREDLDAIQADMAIYCTTYINQAIEEQNESIDMSCLSLLSIPSDIENLKFIPLSKNKLHSLDSASPQALTPKLQVYLQGNNLKEINKKLFQVKNIKILSLRNNRITEIPHEVRHLTNLEEFSVGGNELSYLPAEIKMLPLRVLLSDPNPFLTEAQVQVLNENNLRGKMAIDNEGRPVDLEYPSLKETAARAWTKQQKHQGFFSNTLSAPAHLKLDITEHSFQCTICNGEIYRYMIRQYRMETHFNAQSLPFEYLICSPDCLRVFLPSK